jgi:hypothetical protein
MASITAAASCWKIEIVKRPNLDRFIVLPTKTDRRADLRLDQSKSTSDAGLRTKCRNSQHRPPRNDPPHAQTLTQTKPLLMNRDVVDQLTQGTLGFSGAFFER